MTKKVSKILLYTTLSLLFTIGGFSLLTQTPMFRETVRSTLYKYLENEINANIYIGEINGNLISGFSVDTLIMYVDGTPFIESGKLSVQYNLLDVFNSRLTFDSLTIENPSVSLTRWRNGVWNINRLSKTPPSADTAPSPLVISAGRLRIVNATFHLMDSTGEYDSLRFDRNGRACMNYDNIDLRHVNIDLSGKYSSEALAVSVNNISFTSLREQFVLSKFSGNIERTTEKASLSNLVIVTPSSRLEMNARVNGIDVFSITDVADLQHAQISLNILPSNILTNDVQVFLSSLDFLRGKIYIDGEMEGNFENLSVRKLNTSFGRSSLGLSGTVSNIYKPRDLRLNIVSSKSTINPTDVLSLLPYYGIPDYRTLGTLAVEFQFVGKPLDFLAITKVKSAAGTATVDGQMVITEENIHYKGILAGNNINLEKVFSSAELLSRLNTRIFIDGQGTSMATLNTEATIEIDSSMFRNIPLHKVKMNISVKEKKFETDGSIQSPEGDIALRGSVDFQDNNFPAYSIRASVRNLNLAPVMQSNYYRSNLSFDIERSGKGLTLFDNPSDTKIELFNSNFKGMSLDSAHIVMQWLKDSTNQNKVTVRSPVVDGTLEGTFTINDMVHSIETHLAGLERLYTYQRSIIDTTYVAVIDSSRQHVRTRSDAHSINYDLTLKNLKPISTFFKFPQLEIIGTAKGTLFSDSSGTSSSGNIAIVNGSYADSTTPIAVKNVRLDYSAQKISPKQFDVVNDSLTMDVSLQSDEIGIANTLLRMTTVDVDFARQHGQFRIVSDIDTTVSLNADGSIDVDDYANHIHFANLFAKYQGLDIQSAHPFTAAITANRVHIDSSTFFRRNEEIFVRGDYEFQGSIMADATVKNFDLSDIFFVNTSPKFRESAFALGGTIDVIAKIAGSVSDPVIMAKLDGKGISYKNSNFGDLSAAISYAKKKGAIKVELNDHDSTRIKQKFTLEGIVPIDLSFTSADDRMNIEGLDLELNSENLSAAVIDVFIPEIDQISGRINGKATIKGSLVNPIQVGNFQLDSGRVRLEMTGIHYNLMGKIFLDSQKVLFSDFTIFNLKEDYSDGVVAIDGFIKLNGFAPSEYHLSANGELMVLQDRSRTSSNQSFFGRLIGQTGTNGLRFEGTFERSRVIGDIFVEDAFLTFPPTQQAASLATARFDDVVFIDDTSRSTVDSTALKAILQLLTPAVPSKLSERTFLDGFGYELTIETRGNVRIQMIFNANAGAYEELFAELNGKMVLKKDETTQQLTGTINVGDGSNYKFYKEFKATGSLTFVGDPQNPQLNIIAKYEGMHLKNPDNPIEERIVVSLLITGSRNNPKVAIGLASIDESGREIPHQGDIENDAITFLLTSSRGTPGQFREELSTYDRNRLGSQLTEAIGGTFINSLLSGMVNDFVTKNNIPYVKRVEFRNVTTETDINTILEVSDAVINIGGKVFTDVNNTNVSIQIPVLGKQNRSFIFEVEKKTENADYTSIQTKNILGARLFYRFTF